MGIKSTMVYIYEATSNNATKGQTNLSKLEARQGPYFEGNPSNLISRPRSRLYEAGGIHLTRGAGSFEELLTSLRLQHVLLHGSKSHPSRRLRGRTPGCIPS